MAAITLMLGMRSLSLGDVRKYLVLFGALAAIGALAIVQLIPWPPFVWQQIPGHQIVVEIDRKIGLYGEWRPISLAPNSTLNALLSLLIPAAFLVHLAKLSPAQIRSVLIVAIGLCMMSGVLGIAQVAGSADSRLYLYDITNNGFAVGLFSNRNHEAVVLACLFPMLAAYAAFPVKERSTAKMRLILALLAGMALIPLILITGSRSGAVLGLLGLLSVRWVYSKPQISAPQRRESKRKNYNNVLGVVVLFVLGGMTAISARVSVFDRFSQGSDALKDVRFQVWRPIFRIVWDFFPFGSGLGSFPEVYGIYEPTQLLDARYLNHAHNDLLEIALTGGLFGMAIVAVCFYSFIRSIFRAARSRNGGPRDSLIRMGAVVVSMLAFASLVDYPLRTPSVACIFILATVCLRQERVSEL
jgi:O-antigen ligase